MDSISEIWFKFFAQIAQRKGDISLLRIFFSVNGSSPDLAVATQKLPPTPSSTAETHFL